MSRRIHALPDMGADHRMFPEPWSSLPNFIAHDWSPYRGESTISEVALSLCDRAAIQDGDSLIGTSLGGIVACEITKVRQIQTLYLIGSATHKAEVNRLLAGLHPLAAIAPLECIKLSSGKIPTDLTQMFARADAEFVRAMCSAIFDWDGFDPKRAACFRIHGRKDRVIPLPDKVDLILDGGHLIAMSHAAACTEFVRARELERYANQPV